VPITQFMESMVASDVLEKKLMRSLDSCQGILDRRDPKNLNGFRKSYTEEWVSNDVSPIQSHISRAAAGQLGSRRRKDAATNHLKL